MSLRRVSIKSLFLGLGLYTLMTYIYQSVIIGIRRQENVTVQFRGREDGDHLILLYTDWWSDHEGLEMSRTLVDCAVS